MVPFIIKLGKKVGDIGYNKLVKKKRIRISDFKNAYQKLDELETDQELIQISNKDDAIFFFHQQSFKNIEVYKLSDES